MASDEQFTGLRYARARSGKTFALHFKDGVLVKVTPADEQPSERKGLK